KNIRQYIFGNYLIFYLIRIDDIQIVRVLHGKRDIPNLF
ncbi:MAG TPA: type II toxin-antitoxin system RelE/ParE family toxin, partial [Bacteroidetes bacterium]|nr:type II toxin-antitoxin system RelE/ParE family toxin [Bacteroidota bacterium]